MVILIPAAVQVISVPYDLFPVLPEQVTNSYTNVRPTFVAIFQNKSLKAYTYLFLFFLSTFLFPLQNIRWWQETKTKEDHILRFIYDTYWTLFFVYLLLPYNILLHWKSCITGSCLLYILRLEERVEPIILMIICSRR